MKSLFSARRTALAYFIAVAGIGLTFGVRLLLPPIFEHRVPPFTWFAITTMAAAWLGGYRPGLVATGCGLVLGLYFFNVPQTSFVIDSAMEWSLVSVYLLLASLAVVFIENLHRTRRRLVHEMAERKEAADALHHREHIVDVTARKQAEEALRENEARFRFLSQTLAQSAEQQKKLSRQLLELQESERRRIARELHDQVGQGLSLVQLHLQGMQMRTHLEPLQSELRESYRLVEDVIEQVQKLSVDLRPTMLDDLGLIAALRWYTNQARSIGLNAVFTSNTPAMRLDATLETACYRIVQEALTNVVRHAKARWVAVDLRQNGSEFHVTIADNGVGFDLENIQQRAGASACLGLLGMQERAALSGGRVEIKSLPGHGTEVHARFPIGPPVQQCHDSTVQRLNDSTL